MARPIRVGLTGGIGSGKSTVATLLAELGAAIVDTDLIARQLTLPGGSALGAIANAFGVHLIGADRSLDRAKMREIVFADPTAKRRLEAILHPLIGAETERQASLAATDMVVFDIPLLVETGRWPALVDRVWVVDCEVQTQVDRVVARSGWTDSAVRQVIAQQADRSRRRSFADAIIYNDTLSMEDLRGNVRQLWLTARQVPVS